jgi:hypothetical protein
MDAMTLEQVYCKYFVFPWEVFFSRSPYRPWDVRYFLVVMSGFNFVAAEETYFILYSCTDIGGWMRC